MVRPVVVSGEDELEKYIMLFSGINNLLGLYRVNHCGFFGCLIDNPANYSKPTTNSPLINKTQMTERGKKKTKKSDIGEEVVVILQVGVVILQARNLIDFHFLFAKSFQLQFPNPAGP